MHFLDNHKTVSMPDWGKEEVLQYLQDRIPDNEKRADLIRHLIQLKLLEMNLTPWHVKYISSACGRDARRIAGEGGYTEATASRDRHRSGRVITRSSGSGVPR